MINIMFISRQRLVGPTNGSSTYLLELARAVRGAGMRPHLIQPSPSLMGRWPVLRLRPEMAVFETHAIRGVLRVGNLVISRDWRIYAAASRGVISRLARKAGFTWDWFTDRPQPYAIAVAWSDKDRSFTNRHLAGRANVIVADYMFQAEAFSCPAARPLPKAIVMHDLFHARAGKDPSGRNIDSVVSVSRDDEVALLSKADAVIAIQSNEQAFLRDALPGVRPILAPIAAHPVSSPQPGDGERLLFVASNTAPNVVGLNWFFEQVWPSILTEMPNTILEVAGNVHLAFPNGGPRGVRFLGLVESLEGLYRDAGVVISPLTFGSGLKIKLIEAMAKGKAIVATSITVEGVEKECAGSVEVTDDPERFAARLVALQRDPSTRQQLATAALEAARRHFSPDAMYGSFINWLREVSPD